MSVAPRRCQHPVQALGMSSGKRDLKIMKIRTRPSDANPDFLENYELACQDKYATRSAIYYWTCEEMYAIADSGAPTDVVDNIAKVINPGFFASTRTSNKLREYG